jgi:DNA invertase Pin-like site-specific DNA recombinase
MSNKNKCAIYIRVSKMDGSQNPLNQLEPLKRFAEAKDLEVFKVYRDECSAGTDNRPEYKQMLLDGVKGHCFSNILVWSLDRFSRSSVSKMLASIEALRKNNIFIVTLKDGIDTSQEGTSNIILALMSALAVYERERISERTKAGLLRVKSNGQKLGRPFGAKDKRRRRTSGYILRYSRQKAPASYAYEFEYTI